MNHRVLIVEDEEILADSIARFLQRRGFVVEMAGDGEEAWERLQEHSYDAIATDIQMPRCDGLQLLERMRKEGCREPAIVMSAHGDFERVVAAMRLGAHDFLRKPVDLEELEAVLRRSMSAARLQHELSYLRSRNTGVGDADAPLGDSPAMKAVCLTVQNLARVAERLAPGQTPPLLMTGETGTGKGLVARYYHRLVSPEAAPFIEVNCTSLQPALIASELFGHERGAFTDARVARKGLFEAASSGTLYLDEIGHLQPDIQGNLLTAIEDKTIRAVGDSETRHVDVRIIATTNVDLEQSIEAGGFRSDLFYRLATFHIRLPPLRERRADIALLARAFSRQFAAKYGGRPHEISSSVVELLYAYDWPGNVRELKNLIERAVVLAEGRPIDVSHLSGLRVQSTAGEASSVPAAAGCFVLPPEGVDLEDVEADLMQQALAATKGNIAAAARLLGMTRSRFRSRQRRRR